jgi:hypothetical protein
MRGEADRHRGAISTTAPRRASDLTSQEFRRLLPPALPRCEAYRAVSRIFQAKSLILMVGGDGPHEP